MLEREKYLFYDTTGLTVTEGIHERATEAYIRQELNRRFPEEIFPSITVTRNDTGTFQQKSSLFEKLWGAGKKIINLPDYYEVLLTHKTGQFQEELTVWSPLAWNDRFAGTAGGGTGIGGRNYLTAPDNTTRGWTVPMAVMNGFTAATMYAGNIEGWNDHTIDEKTGELRREIYENWRVRSTHNMTRFGKAIAVILHNRPVQYSYMNGGSGGGRQSLMEAQNYPEDYDGIWAACPAINWHAFLLEGFWGEVVMRAHHHYLPPKKNQYMMDAVHNSYGGKEAYYKAQKLSDFDATSLVGQQSPGGVITDKDAEVMNEIWRGPHRADGTSLWYGYYPGTKNWQVGIPIGAYYYPLFGRKVKANILTKLYARWIVEDPKENFKNLDAAGLEQLYEEGMKKFADCMGDNPNLDSYIAHGGKLMIDHGLDDPLIPTRGTIDYYEKLTKYYGSKEKVDEFCRLYLTPGDNHGNCWGNGPGITESDGMTALMNWVEQGIAPKAMRKVRVSQKTGETIEEGMQEPY